MKKAYICVLSILAMLLLASVAAAAPLPVVVEQTKVDGTEVDANALTRLDVKRDQEVEVKVKFYAATDLKDVDVRAYIAGYEYNDYEEIGDLIHLDRMEENVSYVKTLDLMLPDDVEEDNYQLRLLFADKNDEVFSVSYDLKVDLPRHELKIDDVILYPETEVKSGSALLATVRIDNQGQRSEDDVKVTVAIPDLGVSASTYVDDVDSEDEEETEELYMRIPACSEPGFYDVDVTVEYNKHDTKEFSSSIYVVEDDTCMPETATETKTRVVAGNDMHTVNAGEGVIFPVTVTNGDSSSKSFSINVAGVGGWADVKVSPASTLVIESGKTKSFYVLVSPNTDVVGLKAFTASVTSGADHLEQLDFTLNVEPSAKSSDLGGLKKALGIGILVLVVLLIILGLIIGFSRLDDNDGESNAKTYY